MTQHRAGLQLIASGAGMLFLGLLWGPHIPNTPFPRLAVTAHVGAMTIGCMIFITGLLVEQTDILELSPLQQTFVVWGMNSGWITVTTEAVNAYWGAKHILPIAASQAGSSGAAEWQEAVVSITHMVAGPVMIVGFGVLVYELFMGKKGLDLMGMTKEKAESLSKRLN